MATRSKVELFEQIPKTREREGLSVRGLARRFNTHRRTVRLALASPVPPPRKPSPGRVSPVLDPWKANIDGWLEADRDAPKKQRHTARRIWQRLVEEYGADVGESTVRRYVREARGRHPMALREVTVPQHHPLGEEAELAGIRAALGVGSIDAEVVAIEARKVAERAVAPVVPIGTLSRYDRSKPTLTGYDTLLEASS